MKNAALLLVIFASLSVPNSSVQADKIDDYVNHEIAARKVPGLVFAVMENGHIIAKRAYGFANVETGARMRFDSVFELASLTKPITATAVMMLVQEGKVRLDDPIITYIAEAPPSWKNITVRHLLSHTSGLRGGGWVECDGSPLLEIRTKQHFDDIAKSPLLFEPGEGAEYSDPGYLLLGMIIEKISGKSYQEFLSSYIFDPLHMSHSSVLDRSAILPNRVSPYTLKSGQLRNGRRVWQHELPSYFGVLSTVEDLAKFDAALSTSLLLKSETLAQMWTPAKLKNGQDAHIDGLQYGLGWFLRDVAGHRIVGHPGFLGSVMLRYVDDHITIIVLTNLDADAGNHHIELAQGILRLIRPKLPGFLMP